MRFLRLATMASSFECKDGNARLGVYLGAAEKSKSHPQRLANRPARNYQPLGRYFVGSGGLRVCCEAVPFLPALFARLMASLSSCAAPSISALNSSFCVCSAAGCDEALRVFVVGHPPYHRSLPAWWHQWAFV
ncbi:hypothetical protein GH714_042737 [Hevea brasiliensis]|uniref:Uncharacterized protein n=1 Tax=Hevea brasiliensis TaxID=3981 RepID=A0A6A6K0Q9_HEVBR|nr:hypothetical protein GH714_042737 [Hevea brasiliensis]